MKYMKIGSRPDIFHTEKATRSVSCDSPSDLTIVINKTKYLIHKFSLLPKCDLLQRFCADHGENPIELHDIPGGEEAFEMCAKFCYGIVISLSAYNFVSTFCAAKYLRMTELAEKGNFLSKLEFFFHSYVLQGWKDSVVALGTTSRLPEWSENLGIIRSCVDSIVEKILSHPSKVTWAYTYTRPGYSQKPHRSVPKDWWTEDISDLDIELFRCIIAGIRSLKQIPSPLIGEALHVYASRWLPHLSSSDPAPENSVLEPEAKTHHRRVLNSIVGLLPIEKNSVSIRFLLKLFKVATLVGSPPSTKGELIRRAGQKLDEAAACDLLLLRQTHSDGVLQSCDVSLIGVIVESFLLQFRDQSGSPETVDSRFRSLHKVGKLIDQFLQSVARDFPATPVSEMVALAEALPEYARPAHDELYKAINIYLKGHPEISKAEKKRLCQMLDCRKLSTSACMHALRNERLPLRTLVQLLFIEQGRTSGAEGGSTARGGRTATASVAAESARTAEHGKPAEGLYRRRARDGRKEKMEEGSQAMERDEDSGLELRRRGKSAASGRKN